VRRRRPLDARAAPVGTFGGWDGPDGPDGGDGGDGGDGADRGVPGGPVVSGAMVGPAEPLDDFDTTAEVDATFRTQRRVAIGYFAVFLAVTLAVPALTLVLGWWSSGRIVGMSPSFVMAAGGLYAVFFLVALAASSLADAIEDRMLGGGDEHLGALPAAKGPGVDGLGPDPEHDARRL
jgi:hypothetical protein